MALLTLGHESALESWKTPPSFMPSRPADLPAAASGWAAPARPRGRQRSWLGHAVVFLCFVVLVFTGARSQSYLAMSGRLVHRSRDRSRVCREITLAPSLSSSASP